MVRTPGARQRSSRLSLTKAIERFSSGGNRVVAVAYSLPNGQGKLKQMFHRELMWFPQTLAVLVAYFPKPKTTNFDEVGPFIDRRKDWICHQNANHTRKELSTCTIYQPMADLIGDEAAVTLTPQHLQAENQLHLQKAMMTWTMSG